MSDRNRMQSRLLLLAALFLACFALALSLSPAVRARSWQVELRWQHWLGYAVWLAGFWLADRQSRASLPRRDPYLLPLAALLCGWGLLTIWRLTPTFGLRQTIWLGLGLAVLIVGLRRVTDLSFLPRYKYLWLTGGLLLTALTLIFGTNPLGAGPRLWLGCCGLYFQPSEPLKLLLLVYLAGYFAAWMPQGPRPEARPAGLRTIQILLPTLVMSGLALLLMVIQRDLGTASIFIALYAAMVFLATGWRWVPLTSGALLGGAGLLGYALFDVIRLRVDAWLNPWLDPAGRSYQIVQSLLAVANGGLLGRGPGLGNPGLVPVAHSDFIFAALAEESGLLGVIALLTLIALLAQRAMIIALGATQTFNRLLAAGLAVFLAGQSLLIIGGNLRLLPLTGVTLPLISYGGSSLGVSFLMLLILLKISAEPGVERADRPWPAAPNEAFKALQVALTIALGATALAAGWWGYQRGPDLLARTDNPRRAIADRFVQRGALLGRRDTRLAESVNSTNGYVRQVNYPALGPVLGYTHPVYGQAGLEAGVDDYLRGLAGHAAGTIWWHHILYGQPPPGLDVRLTLDLARQQQADELLGEQAGAIILMNASTGELLVLATHPAFDPNRLDENWEALVADPAAPLLNRTTQASYPAGELWAQLLPGADLSDFLANTPQLRLPVASSDPQQGTTTPIQVALAAAVLSNQGVSPAARLALAVQVPESGWQVLPVLNSEQRLLEARQAAQLAQDFQVEGRPFWQLSTQPAGEAITWYVAGSLPQAERLPLVVVVVLESSDPAQAEQIGQALLQAVLGF
ncbi:MAG: FtsW/RodA/SpoVE family cell cycle protein [Anaerolineales bacterium]|nr:FtsW/RodA/SpoVE family cell cycle protein [Anaerolineales bacterium]